jgi:ATP-dependent helicase Lhr and Lhr-like helicase
MTTRDELFGLAENWFREQGWKPFPFQKQTWTAYLQGKNGLLNAPTGSGKTYALWVPVLLEQLQLQSKKKTRPVPGIKAIWITPLRALSVEIKQAAERLTEGLGVPFTVGIRSGDTGQAERNRQRTKMPDLLITTPESLHLLLATKGWETLFRNCRAIVTDEWHELLGSKRGVQMELALSRLKTVAQMKIWGISATIGNLEQAREVLLGPGSATLENSVLVRAALHRPTQVISVLPEKMDSYPWRGHLGLHLVGEVAKIIRSHRTTLVFTNVRSACEQWYLALVEQYPEFAGAIAMHHSSIDRDVRLWVEQAIRDERLKAVVCTSSLDLGVDFAPVETIVQVGGPKGVARFLQRAGRSNHRPGEGGKIYFLATHAIELIEASALKKAIKENAIEDRTPYLNCWDVLVQYLNTLAVSDGFRPETIFPEIKSTFCYQAMTQAEWEWVLNFIVHGSQSLQAYDEYRKVEIMEDGLYRINRRLTAMHHRMQIGTIVSDASMRVKFLSGGYIGTIEEAFVSKLKPGDTFLFAGRKLELVRIRNMEVQVRKAGSEKPSKVASWLGGRLALSQQMSVLLRQELYAANHERQSPELRALEPVFRRQRKESIVPDDNQFLVESFKTREGYHTIFYPFEGRFVNEALASLLAWRISLLAPYSFSLAYNDYGFELLSDREIDVQQVIDNDLFTVAHVHADLQKSLNSTEMARRRFRDIAVIAGLVFSGMPGKPVKAKHLQSGTQLLFEVFRDYEPDNLLLLQAYRETFEHQLEEGRLIRALERIASQEIVWKRCDKPTPFSFPIITDRLRERLSSESLAERIRKMTASYMKNDL